MKTMGIFGIFLAFSMLCMSFGTAEDMTDVETASVYVWNGTWSSPNYTLYIYQDESGISGVYVPMDLLEYDSGYLEGNLSSDEKTYGSSIQDKFPASISSI